MVTVLSQVVFLGGSLLNIHYVIVAITVGMLRIRKVSWIVCVIGKIKGRVIASVVAMPAVVAEKYIPVAIPALSFGIH